jgi:hypothetical protein
MLGLSWVAEQLLASARTRTQLHGIKLHLDCKHNIKVNKVFTVFARALECDENFRYGKGRSADIQEQSCQLNTLSLVKFLTARDQKQG